MIYKLFFQNMGLICGYYYYYVFNSLTGVFHVKFNSETNKRLKEQLTLSKDYASLLGIISLI